MQRVFTLFPLLAMLALVVVSPASAEQAMPINPSTCLQCHGDKINAAAFASSVHGKNSCTSCHISIVDVDKHAAGEIPPAKVQCVRCHKKETSEHYASVHMLNSIGCTDCHNQIHAMTPWKKDKRKVVETCSSATTRKQLNLYSLLTARHLWPAIRMHRHATTAMVSTKLSHGETRRPPKTRNSIPWHA